MTVRKSDRIIGCILGGAIGDAVGLPYEGQLPPVVVDLNGKQVSDDTQLTLATCEAMIESNCVVDAAIIASRFASWHRRRDVHGMGASTYKALSGLVAGEHWALVGRKGEYAAGNGAAMRIAPLAFCLDPLSSDARRTIRDVSRITHHNEEAYVGALAVTIAIQAACEQRWTGDSSLLRLVVEAIPDSKVRDRILAINAMSTVESVPEAGLRFGNSGYVVDSVPLALYAAQQISSRSFESIMREVIHSGGDTDTIASISGQIVGTLVGYKALPNELSSQLEKFSFIEAIAMEFAATVVSNESSSNDQRFEV